MAGKSSVVKFYLFKGFGEPEGEVIVDDGYCAVGEGGIVVGDGKAIGDVASADVEFVCRAVAIIKADAYPYNKACFQGLPLSYVKELRTDASFAKLRQYI